MVRLILAIQVVKQTQVILGMIRVTLVMVQVTLVMIQVTLVKVQVTLEHQMTTSQMLLYQEVPLIFFSLWQLS